MTLLIVSFIAGVLTVLAPCVLPLLPVVVGGSLTTGGGNFRKAFTITTALGVSVILFTLLLKATTLFIMVPPTAWQWISGGIIILVGFSLFFPNLWGGAVLARLNARAQGAVSRGYQSGGFWGDVLVGAALGPVFSTCSPTYFIVLATVLPERPLVGFTYLLAYALGLSLMLLAVGVVGQKLVERLGITVDPKGWFRRLLAILFILVGIAVIRGWDKDVQTWLLDRGFFDVTRIERRFLGEMEESTERGGRE